MTNNENWELWSKISFNTKSYRKNFDMISDDENIITEYDGIVSKLQHEEGKLPQLIGEYGFSVWNLEIGRNYGANINKLIKDCSIELAYSELYSLIKKKKVNLKNYNKLVILHNFVLCKDYRKHEITEEFVEMFYRDYYDEKTLILILVQPFQYNNMMVEFYYELRNIKMNDNSSMNSGKYYGLDEFFKKTDQEKNELNLFILASKCGFTRLDDSYLFQYLPEKTIERMNRKHETIKSEDFLQSLKDGLF